MQKKHNAFSLVEVIIATGIISMTLFGIYKMIGENNKIINNSNNYLTQNFLYENANECLKGNIYDETYINFGNNLKSCNFTTKPTITKIDNIEYTIFAKSTKLNGKIIFWKITVESNTLGKTEEKIFRH